jgi:hypothetical protein
VEAGERRTYSCHLYVNAMIGGEAFFIASGTLDGEVAVLGFHDAPCR